MSQQSSNNSGLVFPEKRHDWSKAGVEYTDTKLDIHGQQVMQEWERPYMKELAAVATSNGGTILEIGFGMGISASYIQEHDIHRHYIVEPNYEVFKRLLEFTESAKSKVIPIFGFWQDVAPQLNSDSFDGILFDPHPNTEYEFLSPQFNFLYQAHRLLKPAGLFTYYTCLEESNEGYVEMVRNAGFRGCSGYSIKVDPPDDCTYWDKGQIFVPILTK